MIRNCPFFDRICISDITVISGVRPFGRTVDFIARGRKNHGLLYVWRGGATFFCDGGDIRTASEGALVYLPKGRRYKMKYTAEDTTFVVVNFNLCDQTGEEVSLFEDVTELAMDDAGHRIARTMMNFELCSASNTVEAVLRKKELIYRLLGTVCANGSHLSVKSDIDPQIAEGVHLLEQTYLENRSVEQYAEASHVSINTFRKAFQRQFGTSPLKYRNQLRVRRAQELLSEGGATVAEVAYASGFENVGYFCRYYQQITGETPSETRKKYQND